MEDRYSKVNYFGLRMMKKFYKSNPLDFDDAISKGIAKAYELPDGNAEKIRTIQEIFMINDIVKYGDRIDNFFIEKKELSDFFVNTEINCDSMYDIIDVLDNTLNDCDIMQIDSLTKINGKFLIGAIFNKSLSRTLFFSISIGSEINQKKVINIFVTDGDETAFVSILNDGDTKKRNDFINNKNNIGARYLRFIINMLFYMSAYPDHVFKKAPDEKIEYKINERKSKIITVSNEIAKYLKDTETTPHLRRGHFRYLQSERFTKKRGKTIFVKSTFVKGHAVTVN